VPLSHGRQPARPPAPPHGRHARRLSRADDG
jgi:hypothetical protein